MALQEYCMQASGNLNALGVRTFRNMSPCSYKQKYIVKQSPSLTTPTPAL